MNVNKKVLLLDAIASAFALASLITVGISLAVGFVVSPFTGVSALALAIAFMAVGEMVRVKADRIYYRRNA